MAISYSFIDNEAYGTDDVNGIARDLTGAGVAPFPAQDSYSTSDLNSMTAAMVSSGTSLDGCKCTISGKTVKIGQGIIYFENGVRMTVDEYGYTVGITSGTAGYVFARYSTALQTADIVFAEALPESGYLTVLLAGISADGALTDVRTFARSKVATFGANATFETSFTYGGTTYDDDTVLSMYEYGSVDNVDLSKFNYALISYNMPGSGTETRCYGTFNLSQNMFEGVITHHDSWGYAQALLTFGGNDIKYYVKKVDNRLVLYVSRGVYSAGNTLKYASNLDFKVKLV